METVPTIPAERLHRQLTTVFTTWGMRADHAETAATIMVDTDLTGIDSHGVGMLPHYQRLLREGRLDPRATPAIIRDNGPAVLIDGNKAIGHVPAHLATTTAIEKARQHGIGIAAVTNSNHYGAAGWYARMAAEQGMIAISLTNASHLLVPVHGTQPALGTNPIAFSAPTRDTTRPVLLDMATTTVAYGKVSIARRAGKPLPPGWALNAEGGPETNSAIAAEERRLAPLGGTREQGAHKGYGLALMVEILCATLTGAGSAQLRTGHFFLVLNPTAFRDRQDFQADLDDLIARLRANPPADPTTPVIIPGDPEHDTTIERRQHGIPILPALVEEVRAVCTECGAPFLLG
ncbi:Malate/lactate/ureidoglycolate dehydrogenase, LDH2 family [Roseomonas rosea]|uniref:Malate/lactate/ureidoglycolate dehydrogenase, LDH2 family n=1 Tax=Muricoccus roseus TaxID=198092 RepID=A0A1M6SZL4_9PROT|nr:Ldh family oxidoreductase [Roseomonas rosea]SHK50141.1 Malate/lactate/ureidoglycolate dehydrogenase, LDH2 family [Roseomonas rosea]